MNVELTPSQRHVLEFVESRVLKGDNPPTYREICGEFGYKSPKAAADHIAALEKKGYLSREKGRARSMKLTKEAYGIPLVGRIVAGRPTSASSEEEVHLPIDPEILGIHDRSKAFALRVAGDSMIGRHIVDGDLVLLEREKAPRSGDVIAALIDNESTLKTFVQKDGTTWLQAENPLYPTLTPQTDLTVQGVARAVIRLLDV